MSTESQISTPNQHIGKQRRHLPLPPLRHTQRERSAARLPGALPRYRELGTNNPGTPVVFLVHLAAVLDNWDPRVVDGFAASRRVIAFDNRGIGAPSGSPATSIEQMAKDAITFIKALGFEQVDLFGSRWAG